MLILLLPLVVSVCLLCDFDRGFKTDLIAGTLTAHTGLSTLGVKTRKTASETNFSAGLKRGCRYPSSGLMAGVKRVAPGLSEVKGVGYLGIFPWLPACQLARSRGVCDCDCQ